MIDSRLPFQGDASLVEIDTKLFADETVLRAAHRVTGIASVEFHRQEGKLHVKLIANDLKADLSLLRGTLLNHLLDEELRLRIAQETAAERNLIMAHALSRQPLYRAELEEAPAFSIPQSQSQSSTP